MLTFALYREGRQDADRQVHIDPLAVAWVIETERRPPDAGRLQVAVLALSTGEVFIVEDGARTAARRVRQAKEGAAAGR
jgi:hypothetical protein